MRKTMVLLSLRMVVAMVRMVGDNRDDDAKCF